MSIEKRFYLIISLLVSCASLILSLSGIFANNRAMIIWSVVLAFGGWLFYFAYRKCP